MTFLCRFVLAFFALTTGAGFAAERVSAEDTFITFLTESGYDNEQGQTVVDLLESDYAYVTIKVETIDGDAVAGAVPQLSIEGSSTIQMLGESTAGEKTDADGFFEFAIVGGKMGLDEVRVEVNKATATLKVNVISLKAAGFASPDSVEGTLPWRVLAGARVKFNEDGTFDATFPDTVQSNNRKKVKLAGFMMPLEPQREQKHFLLTSSPPSCFFHIPGGPAGAIEVFSDKGIEATWDMVVLEGTFETVKRGDNGVIYRLREARKP